MAAEEWHPVAHLAEKWHCSKNHVYDLIAKGELRSIQLGLGKAKTRVPQSAVDEYEQRHATITVRRSSRPERGAA